MRIRYDIKNIGDKNRAVACGDLIRYWGETNYKIRDGLNKIKDNKTASTKIVNLVRKHTNTGASIDSMVNAIDAVCQSEMFGFKVNDFCPYRFLLDEKSFVLEIFMDELYFNTKAVMDSSIPRLGKKHSFEKYVLLEKNKWVQWFEKELNKYHRMRDIVKTVLEE